MALCYSRHQYAEFVRDQTAATWLACHRRAFEWFGGRVSRVIIDNAKCAITKACMYDPEVQRAYAECAEGYGFRIDPCPPHDLQKKGIVESGVKYIKGSFVPLREFRSLAGATLWLKATSAMVTLYREHEAVAAHVRATGRGLRRPVADHLPEAAAAWKLRDMQWCLREAERLGPACYALVHALFGDAVLERLRAVQGILRLAHKHGAVRLEAACSRANHTGTQTYRAVKTILDKGVDRQPIAAGFDALAAIHRRRPLLPQHLHHAAIRNPSCIRFPN